MALVGQFEPQACLGDTPGLFRPTTQPTSLLHPEFFPLQSVAIQFATHSWHIPRGEKEEEEGEYDGRLVSERVNFLASYIIPKPPPPSTTMAFAELCVPGVRESSRFLKMANDLLTIPMTTHCKLPEQQP